MIKAVSDEYYKQVMWSLNDFCRYCGALSINELRQGHVEHWLASNETWRRRNAITVGRRCEPLVARDF